MSDRTKVNGSPRRTFLVGLLTGAGVAAAVRAAASPKPSHGKLTTKGTSAAPSGPILYRRTAEAERYYKTLYL